MGPASERGCFGEEGCVLMMGWQGQGGRERGREAGTSGNACSSCNMCASKQKDTQRDIAMPLLDG